MSQFFNVVIVIYYCLLLFTMIIYLRFERRTIISISFDNYNFLFLFLILLFLLLLLILFWEENQNYYYYYLYRDFFFFLFSYLNFVKIRLVGSSYFYFETHLEKMRMNFFFITSIEMIRNYTR